MKNFTLSAIVFTMFSLSAQAQTNLLAGWNADCEGQCGTYAGSNPVLYTPCWWYEATWESGAAATFPYLDYSTSHAGFGSLKIDVVSVQANNYNSQMINQAMTLSTTKKYTIKLWAKGEPLASSTTPVEVTVGIQRDGGTYAGVYKTQSLTSSWTEYVYTDLVMPENGTFVFKFFTGTGGTYWFDDVEFFEQAALPVDLLSFQASASKNKTIGLNWEVADEKRIKNYSIERSAEGQKFTPIGSVAANNNTANSTYAFNDEKPLKGINYYRLKINEEDGTFKYSKVQSVRTSGLGKLSIYPNPTANFIQIKDAESVESVNIYDVSGRLVRQFLNNTSSQLDISTLPKGMYQVAVTANGETDFSRIVKM
jgi:Secretion system C-terminal sorting domain/Carbohydrate binding domain